MSTCTAESFAVGPQLAGLVNYQALLGADRLHGSVGFTAFYAVSSIALEFVLGTTIALVLDSRLPARNVVRSLVIVPLGMAPLVWLSTLPWAKVSTDDLRVPADTERLRPVDLGSAVFPGCIDAGIPDVSIRGPLTGRTARNVRRRRTAAGKRKGAER